MNNLKTIRISKRLTQEEVGKIIGVSGEEIRRKETGVTVLNETQIRKLCEALDVRADYLLGLTSSDKEKEPK